MARKLTEEERNNINLLTAAFVAALPAHLRSHAGSIASSLVRIPREVITMRDINRIVGRLGENNKQKDELRAAIREVALVDVEAAEGEPEAFELRRLGAEEAATDVAEATEGSAEDAAVGEDAADAAARDVAAPDAAAPEEPGHDGKKLADADGAEPGAESSGEAATPAASGEGAEPEEEAQTASEETKPARRRRRRHVGDKGGRAVEQQAKAEEAVPSADADVDVDAAADPAPSVATEAATQPISSGEQQAEAKPAAPQSPAVSAPESASTASPASADAPADTETPVSADALAPVPEQQKPEQQKPEDRAPRGSRNGRGRGRRGNQNGNGGNPKQQGKTLDQVPYIRRGGQTEAELRARIVQLDQRFWMNGWLLSHPGAFELYEKELLALNEFLVSGTMIGDITRRQLAYQMGGDEKFFEYGSDGFKLLRSMGVEDLIRHRPLPKADLLFHAPRRRKHMRVLVTENLDPWLDVHDLMYEDGVSQILGERIHAVVLGGGMPVLEQNRLHLLLDTLGAESYEVLYWGDIDRAGLDILIKLQALLEGKFEVKPFTPAYQLMCDRAMARFPEPGDNEKTGQINLEVGDTSVICDGLTPEAAAYAKAVIEDCCLIPQEILTKRDL